MSHGVYPLSHSQSALSLCHRSNAGRSIRPWISRSDSMLPVIMYGRVRRRSARALSLSLGSFLFFTLTCAVLAQGVQIPRDVDYGASGLVQFNYECETGSCLVRCFLHNTMVLEVKAAKSATFTSYRSHGRQSAPEKEVSVVAGSPETPLFLNFAGDGGCVFEAMRQTSATGFLARLSVDPKSKPPK
jgi:hypothetical protein